MLRVGWAAIISSGLGRPRMRQETRFKIKAGETSPTPFPPISRSHTGRTRSRNPIRHPYLPYRTCSWKYVKTFAQSGKRVKKKFLSRIRSSESGNIHAVLVLDVFFGCFIDCFEVFQSPMGFSYLDGGARGHLFDHIATGGGLGLHFLAEDKKL